MAQIAGEFALHFAPNLEDACIAEVGGKVGGSVFLMKSQAWNLNSWTSSFCVPVTVDTVQQRFTDAE